MNRYNIKIDGEVMPDSYTYEELVLNDVFEFDDIEVKKDSKSNWTNIKSYYFPEEHTSSEAQSSDFYVDDSGQVHLNNGQPKKKEFEYVINEFGEMVQQGTSRKKNNRISSGTSSNTSSPSYSSSTSSGDNTGWKVFFTIVAIIIFIVITCTTGWGSIPAGIVGYGVLKAIWSDDW